MESTSDMRGKPPEKPTLHEFEDLTCDLSAEPIAAAMRFREPEGLVDPNPTLESPPPPVMRSTRAPQALPAPLPKLPPAAKAAAPAIRRATARTSIAAPSRVAPREPSAAVETTAVIAQTVLLEPPVAASAPPIETRSGEVESAAPIGQLLKGRYELQLLLGRGGMASVYKAIDHDRTRLGVADRFVAVKVVQENAARPASPAALIQEFQSAQRLSHPNAINVYDIDRDGDTTFYSMELLSGARLSQLMRRVDGSVLPRPYALAIIRDIGAAVAHAHSRGVVHADLKPSNVMITQEGEVRVLDFGGASMPPREPWVSAGDTDDAYHHATPAYASCEQLERRRADPRDDIYALACITYLLLAGRHPFDYLSSLVARSRRMQAQRPAGMPWRQWRALRQGLNWARADRPDSVEVWLERLQLGDAAAKLPPLADMTAAAHHSTPWLRRLATGAAVIAALVLGSTLLSNTHVDWGGAQASVQSALRSLDAERSGDSAPGADVAQPAPPRTNVLPATPAAAAPAASRSPPAPATMVATAPAATAADGALMRVEFVSPVYTVHPADPAARIIVQRNGSSRDELNFIWWTEADTAAPDVDYASLGARSEHLASGEERATIYVPIISNPLRRRTTQFRVVLADAASHRGEGGAPKARATVMIEGNN